MVMTENSSNGNIRSPGLIGKFASMIVGAGITVILFNAGERLSRRSYTSLLEENRSSSKTVSLLEEKAENWQADRLALEKKINGSANEFEEINKKYSKVMENYTDILGQKEALEKKQADLSIQLVELKEQNTALNKAHSEVLSDYRDSVNKLEALKEKQSDLSEQYSKLKESEESMSKEISILEKNKSELLEKYNDLLEEKSSSNISSENSPSSDTSFIWRDPSSISLLERQIEYVRMTPGLEIVLLTGDLSKTKVDKTGFFRRTTNLGTKELFQTIESDTKRYAILADSDNDGRSDVLYRDSSSEIMVKKGRKDGTFESAKAMPMTAYHELLKSEIEKGFGF
jgi:hypothetical protein